ncbi:hypothetical protein J5N97_000252 [Dioscorea zingiberensis]|uniref:Nitrate transporter n=1 Tax=Dioscorea zingiberensis TaxID=325984 RepID=A0A9D5BST7_9LILI|nr:hypothetical protein J5N97_000252 [Dioscorea zingiberensis]
MLLSSNGGNQIRRPIKLESTKAISGVMPTSTIENDEVCATTRRVGEFQSDLSSGPELHWHVQREREKPEGKDLWEEMKPFEKLGAIGTLSNLLVYLTTVFNMSSVTAATIINIFNGTTNFSTLIGAFVSDTY